MNRFTVSHPRIAITFAFIFCCLLVLTTLVGAAPAAGVPLQADAIVVKSLPTTNFGTATEIGVTGTTPPSGVCSGTGESYLRFNLSGLGPIKSAVLSVNAIGFTGTSLKMHLWGISTAGSASWSEAGITWNNKPTVDTDLNTVANAASAGAIVFGSSSELVQYLESRRVTADATATIVIMTESCSGQAVEQRLGSGNNSTPALRPVLDVVPTAVTMSTFRSADPAVNWPLIVGLGALAAVAIGGLTVTRRRAARR